MTVLPDSVRERTAEPEAAARLFKALGDPIRVRLLTLVRNARADEVCFCDLAEEFDMPQSSLSHHLKILVNAGVLRRERRGTWSWYSADHAVLSVLGQLLRPGGPLRADLDEEADGASARCCG
ncbi:ArsR/SmtB family transcription factor [Umezawaea beigongshangensis]|uniref:ArsR/SmtB family transcription factor n=1 Tax=Umezawaea beigongshangensis TaxID=2780383 RepID=UPI0018F18D22|nr:metalloregulator ArsR/SmtB family transcription factor [Umezawaea beigongshangensis]